jgi:hypothetical protein
VGLGSNPSTPPVWTDIDYDIGIWPGGGYSVYERGAWRWDSGSGTLVAGDVLEISIESGPVVKYYRNASLFYTSTIAPSSYPYVLATTLFRTTSAVSNATISGSGVPTSYNAITDKNPRPKPALPTLGVAGTSSPTFNVGTTLLRVTDANTRAIQEPNRSYRTPSASPNRGWNLNSTLFYVSTTSGSNIPFTWNGTTAARIAGSDLDGKLQLPLIGDLSFSSTQANIIYGGSTSADHVTIGKYDFSGPGYSNVLDLRTLFPPGTLDGTFLGQLMTGGNPTEYLSVCFGGTQQDLHHYALWAPLNNLSARKIVDTMASTINGVPTSSPLPQFTMHSQLVDQSGRYVMLYTSDAYYNGGAGPAARFYIWDTSTDVITPATVRPGGHAELGHGVMINQDCCTASQFDGLQWQFRSLAAMDTTRDVLTTTQTPHETYIADHATWNQAQPVTLVPIISATYRYQDGPGGLNNQPWRAWDDEVIAIRTDGVDQIVWRFAHHRSSAQMPTNPARVEFWATPRPQISLDGKYVLITSNWERTLGFDPGQSMPNGETGDRQDVFLLRLPQ